MIRKYFHLCTVLFAGLAISVHGTALAQDSTTAVVTHIEQIVRLSPNVRSVIGEESFPDYLAQIPDLQNSIFQTLKTSLARKFSVSQVQIQQPAGSWLDFRNVIVPFKPTRAAGNAGLYVAIQQVIQLTTTSADSMSMPVKNFLSTCTLLVQDKTGKTVFTGKVIHPFSTANVPGQMYGLVEIGPEDWRNVLNQSIQAALETTTQRLPSQTFHRPVVNASQYGLAGNMRFYQIQESENNSSYKGSNRDKTISFREIGRTSRQWNANQSYSLNESFLRGEYRTRILMADKSVGTEYEITATSSLTRDSVNIYSKTVTPIAIRCTAQRLLVGDYTMNEKRFEGQVGYDVFSIRMVQPRNTYEVLINDKIKALIQKGGFRNQGGVRRQDTYMYVSRDVDENLIDKILLSYLIYQSANELGRDFLGY